jgi:CD109 antigen
VKVTTSDHIELKEGKLIATINAKYTYGQPIKGNAKVTVYTIPWWGAPKPDLNLALLTKIVPIDGRQVVEFEMKNELKLLAEEVSTYLLIDVSVEEELTGRKLEASTTTTVGNKLHQLDFVEVRNFKPGLPYTIVMQVKCQNDKPLENAKDPLMVKFISDQGKAGPIPYQIGKSGKVTATVNVPKTAKALKIHAKYLETESLRAVDREYSRSDSYIRALVLSKRVVKGKPVAVSVLGVGLKQNVFYSVIGRGTLLLSGHCRGTKDFSTTFEFPTNFQMVPTATLLVYYIRPDGEIVSDRLKLTFEDDLSSEISLELSSDTVQPGEEVKLTVKTAPKSYTALLGVDQSVLLLKNGNDLIRNRVIQELGQYDLPASPGHGEWSSYKIHKEYKDYRLVEAPFLDDFAVSLLILDKMKSFYNVRFLQHSGLVLLTNATINVPDPPIRLIPFKRLCGGGGGPPITIRKEFPETWLWEDFPENEYVLH